MLNACGILAFVAGLVVHFFGLVVAEGLGSIIIGLMMFYVVGQVFLENARGAIGETDEEMLNHIAHIVAMDSDVKDIQHIEVVKEGEFLHVQVTAEVNPTHTLAYIDDIRDRLMKIILNQKGVQDVLISFDEDDGVRTWKGSNKNNKIEDYSTKLPE